MKKKDSKKPFPPKIPVIGPNALPSSQATIRERAHQIYLDRGGAPGREWDDWLLAEHELKEERSIALKFQF